MKYNEFDKPREIPVKPVTHLTTKEIGDRVEKAKAQLYKKPEPFDFSQLWTDKAKNAEENLQNKLDTAIQEYDTPEKKAERDALMKQYLAKGGSVEKVPFGKKTKDIKAITRPDPDNPEPVVKERGMPSSIIKHKQKLAMMTDKELADRFKDADEDKLRRMAWGHGYGNMSSHYLDRVRNHMTSKRTGTTEGEKDKPSDKEIKQAKAIPFDKQYKGGNYSGASNSIEKIKKGLSQHPDVADALRRANEEMGGVNENPETDYEGSMDYELSGDDGETAYGTIHYKAINGVVDPNSLDGSYEYDGNHKIDDTLADEMIKPGGEEHEEALKAAQEDYDYEVGRMKSKFQDDAVEEDDSTNRLARLIGAAEASLSHGLEMAQNIIKKDYGIAEVQAKVIAENWPPLIDKIKNVYKTNERVKEDGIHSTDLKRIGASKPKIYVHKDGKTISIPKSKHNEYLAKGWKQSALRAETTYESKLVDMLNQRLK